LLLLTDFFNELLARSKKEFHEMFKRTYGIIYEQNQHVFTDLFEDLESYFAKGRTRLDRALEKFFNNLYQKMFQVINGQYSFDDK
jgi:glypican 4